MVNFVKPVSLQTSSFLSSVRKGHRATGRDRLHSMVTPYTAHMMVRKGRAGDRIDDDQILQQHSGSHGGQATVKYWRFTSTLRDN